VIGQYMNLIVLLIIIGVSVISFVFRKLQEEAERRAARDEKARREMERLRTGREPGPETESADQMQRAQELQARRQAQLQELRRRQQERARTQQTTVTLEEARIGPASAQPTANAGTGAGTAPSRQSPIVWVPGSSGPTVPQRSPTTARRPQTPQTAGTKPRQQTTPTARPQVATRPQQTTRHEPLGKPASKSLFRAPPPPPPPPPPVVPAREVYDRTGKRTPLTKSVRPGSAEEWRRAIIMHEILSPSLAMRSAGDDSPRELPR
jgi:FtsZ-interacting cell division protein ZipA